MFALIRRGVALRASTCLPVPVPIVRGQISHLHNLAEAVAERPEVPPITGPPPKEEPFWRKIPWWSNVSESDFLSYRWGVSYTFNDQSQIERC